MNTICGRFALDFEVKKVFDFEAILFIMILN